MTRESCSKTCNHKVKKFKMVVEETNPVAATAASHPSGISQDKIDNIMSGISNTGTVKLNNHRKKLRQRFDIIKKLGQGTYGKVQLGINKETGQEVAIKTIKKCKIEAEADLIRIRREVQIMSSVQHPNIIHIYEVFENREKMVLVMEFAAGGELYDYLSDRKVLSEDEARRVFRQVSTAVYYCHKHKICHRDLKLENILLDENGNAKIADFGLSNVFDDRRLLATFCGSPLYASPEIVKGTPYQGPEVDCWSLGVLLYTLVYGSMPFDGSNFSRLVKQISQGDYYEPKKTSRASPLIREMLTANPEKRADIEKICQHWWVNEGYKESCLELAEALANQTPVRLDVLLSLSPMSVTADQLVVPSGDSTKFNDRVSRSHSVGSIRCVANSEAERRILDMVAAGGEEALMPSPTRNLTPISPNQIKRKIEVSASTGNSTETVIKKEKAMEDTDVVEMEIAQADLNLEKNKSPSKLMVESTSTNLINDESNNLHAIPKLESVSESELPLAETSPTKVIKKFVNKHKTADLISAINKISPEKKEEKVHQSQIIKPRKNSLSDEANKCNTDRGRLGGLDISEKFQRKNSIEKGKLNIVSGVNVSNFKKEFERRSSIPSMNLDNKPVEIKGKNAEKTSLKNINYAESPQKSLEESTSTESFSLAEARRSMENSIALLNEARNESSKNVDILCAKTENIAVSENKSARERKLQNARDIIGNAIQPGVRKFSVSKHTYVIPEHSTPLTYVHQPLREQTMSSSFKKTAFDENKDNNIKTSKAEITLKSATLPRRKTSKAEIKLEIQPPISEQPMRFSTEMKHRLPDIKSAPIEDNSKSISSLLHHRATSLGPAVDENREHLITTQKPPMYNKQYFNSRRSGTNYPNTTQSNINNSQLTNLSGTQPIKKSPREFIIPIAVEGGGFITPRSGSIEPSELNQSFGNTNLSRKSRLVSPFLSDMESEENSPFQRTQTTSANRDEDLEPRFSLHRLRSSRPMGKKNSQDSQSSGEEEDDDGFEILTAENLFSTLLQRVRALTNRLNVNNDLSTGFPNSSRLLSNMRTTPFWNQGSFERRLNGTIGAPWRHSLSRDIGSDIESMFSRTATLPRGKELPKSIKKKTSRPVDISSDTQVGQPIDLADLDLSRLQLSKKEFETLSSITPSLPTSFQQQLIAKLPPNHSRKLSRTLSMQNNMEEMRPIVSQKNLRKTDDNIAESMKMIYNNGTKKSSQNKTTKSLTKEFVSEEQQIYPNSVGKYHTENISQLKEPLTFSKTSSIKNITSDLSYKKDKDAEILSIPSKQSDNILKINNMKSFDKLPSGYLSPPPIAIRSKNSLEKRNLSAKSSSVLKSNSVPKEVFNVNNHKKSLERFNNYTEVQEAIQQPTSKNIMLTHEISDIDKKKLTNIILKELENLSAVSQKEISNNKESDDLENKLKHDNKSKINKEISKSNLINVQNINSKTKCNLDIEKSSEFQKEEIQKKTSKLKRPKSYPYKETKTFSNLPTSNNSELVGFSDTNSNCKTSTSPESKFINVVNQSNDPNVKIDIEKNDFNKLLEMTMKDALNNIIIQQKNDEIKTERTKSLNNININNELINILGTKLKKSEEKVPSETSAKTKTKQSEDNNSSGKKSRKGLFLTLGKKIENLRKNSKTDESNNISKLNNMKLKGEEMTKSIPSSGKHSKISSSSKTENENFEDKDSKIEVESVAQSNTNQINANDSVISESGLLKKAVSAGDINKCSVKKLLGLFKRFEKNNKEQKVLSACSTSNVENSMNKIPIKKNSPTDGEKLFTKVKKSTDLMDISNENCKKLENFSLDTYKNKLSGNIDEPNCNINNNNNRIRKEHTYQNMDNIDNGLTNLKDLKKNNSFHISRKFSSDNLNDINDNHMKYHHKNSLRPMSSYHNYNIGDSPVDDIDLRFEDLLSCSEVNRITSNPSSPSNVVSHLEFPSTSTDNNQNDTMMDRIKRRSFYCRFNDNKPKRQSNIVGAAAREYYRETEAKLRSRPQTKFPSFYATTGRRTDSNMSKLISSINNGTSNSLDSADREYTTKINEQMIPMSALHYRKSKQNIHNEKQLLPHSSGHNHYNPPDWNYNHYNTTRNRALLLNETGVKCDSKNNIDCLGNITRPRQYETRNLSSSGSTQNNTRLPLNSSSKHHLRSHSRDATRYLLPFSAIPRSPPNV